MILTSTQVNRWLSPWPIGLPKRWTWQLQIVPLFRCERFYAFWKTGPRQEYRTIAWWADQASLYQMPSEQHYIHMLARERIPLLRSLTILTIRRDGKTLVIDGNHHLIAASLVRRHGFQGRRTELAFIGTLLGSPK